MQLHFDLIDRPESLAELSRALEQESLIAFDTEFIRETTYTPNLALIQVATSTDAWLVDVLAFSTSQMAPLLAVLHNPKILKVLHSAYGDQECLYYSYQTTASPTLDTFEAASLLGFGDSVSLRDLIRSYLNVKVPKDHTRTDWLKRPIQDEMKKYALADVQYLVSVGEKILQELDDLNRRTWALDLSAYYEDHGLFQDSIDDVAERLASSGRLNPRSYAILKELLRWRERRARAINVPRRRVADDGALLDISNARPQNLDQLEKFRGINKGELNRQGKVILDIIKDFAKKPEEELPPLPVFFKPNASQTRVMDLLSTYLRMLSEELRIAPRQLLTSKELKRIVVDKLWEPKQWVTLGLCRPQVAELVGPELSAMLQGKRALTLKDGRLQVIKYEEK